jgi:hypothetical protein
MVNDIDDLREVWYTLNTCYDRPDKYISEALDPVVKFRAYKRSTVGPSVSSTPSSGPP